MTREEMAQGVEALELFAPRGIGKPIPCATIAAELRKTCVTCVHFTGPCEATDDHAICEAMRCLVPEDGSGFCHRWEAKVPPANTEAVTP